ncbi:hypothetical protein B195_010550 [Pseudomonas sp. Lz4W]|nr:hypothetical protein B195_010550 [Pseudomonas sp. Lz4W]
MGSLLVNPRRCIVGDANAHIGTLLHAQTPEFIVLAALFGAVGIGQARDFARRGGALLLRAWLVAMPGVVGFAQLAGRGPVIFLQTQIAPGFQQTAA